LEVKLTIQQIVHIREFLQSHEILGGRPTSKILKDISQPLMSLGDLSAQRVRAELDERDVCKIKLGDNVAVRADAFRGREFAGKVVNIAPIIRPGRINSPESRNLTDFSVFEVLIDLADPGPLADGMKVDVYFQAGSNAQ
jgi:HlyD family secretion protein